MAGGISAVDRYALSDFDPSDDDAHHDNALNAIFQRHAPKEFAAAVAARQAGAAGAHDDGDIDAMFAEDGSARRFLDESVKSEPSSVALALAEYDDFASFEFGSDEGHPGDASVATMNGSFAMPARLAVQSSEGAGRVGWRSRDSIAAASAAAAAAVLATASGGQDADVESDGEFDLSSLDMSDISAEEGVSREGASTVRAAGGRTRRPQRNTATRERMVADLESDVAAKSDGGGGGTYGHAQSDAAVAIGAAPPVEAKRSLLSKLTRGKFGEGEHRRKLKAAVRGGAPATTPVSLPTNGEVNDVDVSGLFDSLLAPGGDDDAALEALLSDDTPSMARAMRGATALGDGEDALLLSSDSSLSLSDDRCVYSMYRYIFTRILLTI